MRKKSSIPIALSVALAGAYILFSFDRPDNSQNTKPTEALLAAEKAQVPSKKKSSHDFEASVLAAVAQAPVSESQKIPEPKQQEASVTPPKPVSYSTNLPLALQGEPIGEREYFEDGNFQVILNREDVGRLAPNLGMLVANAMPSLAYRDGVLVGVEIGSASEGSVLSHFGFESGDIVHAINGFKINDPFEAVLVLKKMNQQDVKITVNRGEAPKELSFLMVE